MFVGALRRGAYLYQCYVGYDYSHGEYDVAAQRYGGAICRLEQRLDGFISADSAFSGGFLVTKPVTFTGSRLEVNYNASALGTIRVALLDEQGEALPGHGIEDCDVLEGNSTAKTVTWKGKWSLSALADQPVQLRFEMRAAKLFAFQFQ